MAGMAQIPLYEKFIQYLKSGFNALDIEIRGQISAFVESRQEESGGFIGRADKPDLYYSLFGFWLSSALDLTDMIEKHKNYILNSIQNPPDGIIDQMALMLISSGLNPDERPQSFFPLLRKLSVQRNKINFSYSFFLLMLLLDAQQRHKWLYNFIAPIWLLFYRPSGNIPCSMIASMILVKKRVKISIKSEQSRLLSYYRKGSGFRAFTNIDECDMLSTAVSLFALKESNYDLSIIAPDCLDFIERNYSSGAFLAGNGDMFADLEYTFYGLLALGCLENGYGK